MSIGIVGIGVVGNALKSYLESKNFFNVLAFDIQPEKTNCRFEDLIQTNFLFLCLPTNYKKEISSYDLTSIEETLQKLLSAQYTGNIIIKSTLTPGTCRIFQGRFDALKIVHNPEFLSVRTALEDLKDENQSIIVGGDFSESHRLSFEFISRDLFPQGKIKRMCSFEESESVKIFCNTFYACKVQIFTEFKILCDVLNIDYNLVRDMMMGNGWINEMHTRVPGPDGRLSFGGMCLPKDLKACLALMKKVNVPSDVLEAVVKENESMR